MATTMRLAIFEPDIPQNAGALMRLAACMDVGLDVIEPAGFVFDDRRLRRSAMDYLDRLDWQRHESWAAFEAWRGGIPAPVRLILLTTAASTAYTDVVYGADDILLLGRESSGVPDTVRAAADRRVRVPVAPGLRSLNVVVAAAMVLGEALRQTRWQGGIRA